MNAYLLGLISKWMMIILSFVQTNSAQFFSQKVEMIENNNQTKSGSAFVQKINYETIMNYNDKLPNDVVITKKEGKHGFVYINNDINIAETVILPEDEVLEVGTGDNGVYVGKMTGYGADCQGCTGILSCRTKEGTKWNLARNGEIYNDIEYGNVRIVAAALKKFPCGTIVKVNHDNLGEFMAIVLDTGKTMESNWSNGIIHMDLAFITEKNNDIKKITNQNVEYNVQRWGW